MITIKAPIELKVRSDLARGYDAFGERIAGNYSLMGLEIGEEELLHMVSAPPEIYLMDGESTTVGGSTFISSRNEEKYNIVNNMLNRILLSVDGELTYQDRTYITDALYKLGVRDDRKFMNEVRRMIAESHLEESFLNNYFEMVLEGGSRELRERTLELSRELVRRDSYHTERSEEDFLSESILHRLQTGAIYQIVSNFNKSLNDTRIELQESMLSEQENVARKMLVQNFLSNVVREEPEMFHDLRGREGAETGAEQGITEVNYVRREVPTETIREERTGITEQRERELRESELVRTQLETMTRNERETAEIVYREGETPTTESPTAEGETGEQIIRERTRVEEPGTTEYRITEQIRTEQEAAASPERGEEGVAPVREGAPAVSGEIPGERVAERLTEETLRTSEYRDMERTAERTERYLTEQEMERLSEREKAELIYREGESREAFEERILERLTRETTEGGETVTHRQTAEYHTTERTGEAPGQDIRTDRITSETLSHERTERMVPGETLPGSVTERLTTESERITERTGSEQRFDHTDRYVTEQGEILRTEHEGSELIFREGTTPVETEAGETDVPAGTIRETETLERERIRETREGAIPGQNIPGEPGERVTEVRSSTTENQSAEYHTTERLTKEQEELLRAERERIERIREAGGQEPVTGENLRERLEERITSESLTERERTEAGTETIRSENYVTEPGEILRTEHEGAELIYREDRTSETGEPAAGRPETVRETSVLEKERIRETGEPGMIPQRIPGEPGERLTESTSSTTESRSTEYRTTESYTTEPGTVIQREQDRTETIRETGGEGVVSEERILERLEEQITSESITERERIEAGSETLRTENYVTEQGEILRTEHEGAELIYREGTAVETEGVGAESTEGIRESREIEREHLRERDRLERDRSSQESKETLSSMVRSELRQQLETERIRSEQIRNEVGQAAATELEQAELVYRETAGAGKPETGEGPTAEGVQETRELERERRIERERLERDRRSSETRESTESAIRSELREQLRTERIRTEQTGTSASSAPGSTYERSELIYREAAETGAEGEAPGGRTIRQVDRYRSDNVYERELLEKEKSRTEVTQELTAAVLLDVVKTLFHAGYDRISKGDTWIEYRGALYHSAENTFNRLNFNLEQREEMQIYPAPAEYPEVVREHTSLSELQEIVEQAGDVETIENTIREMNEMNLQNVERYQQMVQVLKTIRPERKRTGGKDRTRQEALSLLDDEQALYESLQQEAAETEGNRTEVFHEIERLFPDHSMEVFRVLERSLEQSGRPESVGISRNNIEAAAEEIRRITTIPTVVQETAPEPQETESSELIYRRNDRLTQEEVQEMMESFRRMENRQQRVTDQRQEIIENERRNTYSVSTNSDRMLSRQEAENIEELVSRGVRSQMSAISEQVLQKLEKKLRNEKIRRGI